MPPPAEKDNTPKVFVYISTDGKMGPGKIYQLNYSGRVMGVINTPQTVTGLTLHRQHGLVTTMPSQGRELLRVDDTGKTHSFLKDSDAWVSPVDVAISGRSDAIVVADNMTDKLMMTSTGGIKPKLYQRVKGNATSADNMSIAITNDKHVIYASDNGIYRFSGDERSASSDPILPKAGGVAADPQTDKWAATQAPNLIHVYEGDEKQQTLTLPPGKTFYRNGLISFSPTGSVCVAVRDSDKGDEPWLLMFDDETGEIRSLFKWDKETMTDFVAGPRMYWQRNTRSGYQSTR